MTSEFKDKVILITGATGGIGYVSCLSFGAAGAIVQAIDIDRSRFEELEKKFSCLPGKIDCYQVDVSSAMQCKELVNCIIEKFNHIDLLLRASHQLR